MESQERRYNVNRVVGEGNGLKEYVAMSVMGEGRRDTMRNAIGGRE